MSAAIAQHYVIDQFPPGAKVLIAQCQREVTDHIRLVLCSDRLQIAYGVLNVLAQFQPINRETLYFEEFPELRALHDGYGWIWEEVWNLVRDAECAEIGTPIHIYLSKGDVLWRAENQIS